jgi:hypothetical protein
MFHGKNFLETAKMKFNLLAGMVLAAQALAVSPALQKRYPTGSFSLLAYGAGSGPISVFYSDGN